MTTLKYDYNVPAGYLPLPLPKVSSKYDINGKKRVPSIKRVSKLDPRYDIERAPAKKRKFEVDLSGVQKRVPAFAPRKPEKKVAQAPVPVPTSGISSKENLIIIAGVGLLLLIIS